MSAHIEYIKHLRLKHELTLIDAKTLGDNHRDRSTQTYELFVQKFNAEREAEEKSAQLLNSLIDDIWFYSSTYNYPQSFELARKLIERGWTKPL